MNWYLEVLKKYVVFSGRARRQEFWMFTLFNVIIIFGLSIIEGLIRHGGTSVLASLYDLAVLLPSLGVSVRRLHDTGRSGWWLLLGFIPVIGLVVVYFAALDSTPGENQYGPNPKMSFAQ